MSKKGNGDTQSSEIVNDVEYENVEALESEVEKESGEQSTETKEEKKKNFLNFVKSGVKNTGKILIGVAIGVGGSFAAGYLMSRNDRPAALDEGEVEYYDFDGEEETPEEEQYPGD